MNQTNKQEAKIALVTGGARRIGAAIVKQLHANGYKVIIHCHQSLPEAHTLAAGLNEKQQNSALVLQRELLGAGAATEIMETVHNWSGRLDLLINNASVFIRTEFTEFVDADWNALFDIHVKVPFYLVLQHAPYWQSKKGQLLI